MIAAGRVKYASGHSIEPATLAIQPEKRTISIIALELFNPKSSAPICVSESPNPHKNHPDLAHAKQPHINARDNKKPAITASLFPKLD
jgi:hypothetical protein